MFIGRNRELQTLDKLYQSNKFEFAVVYGRRRVGKTALINEFLENKPAIYFTGVESNEHQNLRNFSQSIADYRGDILSNAVFPSFQDALTAVFEHSQKERLVLFMDEYPYVAHASESLASTLQYLIDQYKETSKLMLILCGSSMTYIEDKVLSYKSPLYGRRTAQLKIEPFGFFESNPFFNGFSDSDKALAYGIVGGTPQYLLQLDSALSIEENIKKIYLNTSSFLFEEPINLLKQEVREPALYTAIVTAIAGGASRMNEISLKVGEPTNVCARYLDNLLKLGIIHKEIPYGKKKSHKPLYSIADNMFRFWYRFVLIHHSLISRGAIDIVYGQIKPHLSEYMGKVFEEICIDYLWHELFAGKCPVIFKSLGRWWGNDPHQKKQVEIDIMGEQDMNTALFAECKWTNQKVDLKVLETLVQRSKLFHYPNTHFYLFSKSGFTEGCVQKAEQIGNVTLVSYEEMMFG